MSSNKCLFGKMLLTSVLLLFGTIGLFVIVFYLARNTKGEEKRERMKQKIKALKMIEEDSDEILTRPNGQFDGVIPSDGHKTYSDEGMRQQRDKIVYWNLDGKKTTEKTDVIQEDEPKNVLDPEHSGGVALTWYVEKNGDIQPVLTGIRAKKVRSEMIDNKAIKREVNKINDDYKDMKRKYQALQKKRDSIKEERNQLEEEIKEFSETNERINTLNNRLKTLLSGERARADALETSLNNLKNRHDNLEEEITNYLKGARNRMNEKIESVREGTEGGGKVEAESSTTEGESMKGE